MAAACYLTGNGTCDADGVELCSFSCSDAIPSPSIIIPCTAVAVIGKSHPSIACVKIRRCVVIHTSSSGGPYRELIAPACCSDGRGTVGGSGVALAGTRPVKTKARIHSVFIFFFAAAAASAIFIILFSPFDPVVIARLQGPPRHLHYITGTFISSANPLPLIRCGRSLPSLRSPLVLSRLRMRVQ